MPEILKDLYYGNISPFEAPIPAGSPIHKLASKLAKCEDALTGLLDENGEQIFKEYIDIQQQLTGITAEENFILGFRLGVQIMAECLNREGEG